MGPSRRAFTKEFKAAALKRLETGASPVEVALACDVNLNVLRRWRRESGQYGPQAFSGYGKRRAEIAPRTRAVVFRLTQAEFNHLQAACRNGGARSLSEFARSQVLRGAGQPSLSQIEQKLDDLRSAINQLAEVAFRS